MDLLWLAFGIPLGTVAVVALLVAFVIVGAWLAWGALRKNEGGKKEGGE